MSKLIIPLDLSDIPPEERGQQLIKVAVMQDDDITSQTVKAGDKAQVEFEVDPKRAVSVAVGSDALSDRNLFKFQTLTTQVSPRLWRGAAPLTLPPLVVTPRWWKLWLRWCRDFVIEGTVVCADGSPVPGAEVRAFDVDYFFWWSSVNQVGPVAVTDANGFFRIEFRWCCGWWPWWWWKLRAWRLDPLLVEKIHPVLRLNPELKFREPGPTPTADFVNLQSLAGALQGPTPARTSATGRPLPAAAQPKLSAALATTREVTDPSIFSNMRDQLLHVLPRVPELERLQIWPWWPWRPWLDCHPDIIFQVTQSCGGGLTKVIVDEGIFDTRWDVPAYSFVNLVANEEACCVPPPPVEPDGDCALITSVCGVIVDNIGGNAGAAGPDGYADPGSLANPDGRDRPFSEVIQLHGQFGTSAQADFYAVEYADHGVNNWAPVPPAALLGFHRGYFDGTQPWPNQWFYPGFNPTAFGGVHVYQSRRHYEDTHPPANWGSPFGRSWFSNLDLLAPIQTAGNFADGTYDFRLVGYTAQASGDPDLGTYTVLEGCGGDQNNLVVVRLDNRVVTPPTPGSVHVNTSEPDCGITSVKLNNVTVAPCGAEKLQPGTPLEISFFVTDPDGHLDHYELVVKYDLGSFKNLLNAADVGAFSFSAPFGVQPGPDYSDALGQGAVRPEWKGGQLTLHIDDAAEVFPKTCCYLVELTTYKRNIVNCSGNLTYYNLMHYSFTVTV